MQKKKCKLLLVLAASSLFALSSCGQQDVSSSSVDSKEPTSSVSSQQVKTYYAVTLTTGEHYTIEAVSGYNAAKVEKGKEFKFKVVAKEGYNLVSVKAGNTTLTDKDGVYTLTNIQANTTITVEVALKSFKVHFAGEHFTATPYGEFNPEDVKYGADYKFTIAVEEHYLLKSVKVGENALTAVDNVYTIANIMEDKTVTVATEIENFAITYEATNATITAMEGYNKDKVDYGADFRFKVTPDEHYHVASVKVGETTLTPDAEGVYTISKVAGATTIKAVAEKDAFKVNFAGEHFTATAHTGFNKDDVKYGDSFKFTVTPEEHYHIVSVKVGETTLTAVDGVYTLTRVETNQTVAVLTEIDSFAISFSGEHITATPMEGYDANKVNYGADFKFKVAAEAHYNVVSVKDGDTLLTATEGVYTLTNVTKATTITLTAELDTHTVTFTGEGYEVIEVEGFNKNSITHGGEYSFKLKANEHTHVSSVKVGEKVLTTDGAGTYTISNIVDNITVAVTTAEDTYKLTMPSNETYTITLAEEGLDLNAVTYSKEVKFKVTPAKYHSVTAVKLNGNALTVGEDGYYLVKNQVFDAAITVEIARNKATVTFNSNGGTAIEAKTIDQGTLVEEATPTRAGDTYYDTYTFGGWYLNGKKFDFSTVVESDITLVAKWNYGTAKYTNSDVWAKENFTFENGAALETLETGFSKFCWDGKKVDTELRAKYIAEFGKTNDDGWMLTFDKNTIDNRSAISLPKTNFHELLAGGKIARTEIGGYNTQNNMYIKAGGADTMVNKNDNTQAISNLAKTSLTFYEDSEGKVRINYVDTSLEKPSSDSSRYGEIVLTDDEANGTSSIQLHSTQDGASRRYWLGKLRITNGERTFKDFSNKTGFTVEGGTIQSYADTLTSGKAPFGQWKAATQPVNQAVGIYGTNASGATTLTLDAINLNELLTNDEGIRFTLGAWNGGETMSFMDGENTVQMGTSDAMPQTVEGWTDATKLTKEGIEKTWRNWVVTIDKVGVHVHNVFENKDYDFALSEGQLNGTESLVFKLGKASNNHFYMLTNMMTYHI
mgnify:CR=1 FL=1